MNQTVWKNKMQEIIQLCQDELKKTTEIGKRMLSASKTNTCLRENYEELGVMVAEALEKGELKWSDERVEKLLKSINNCKKDLENIEGEVNKIKTTGSEDQGIS